MRFKLVAWPIYDMPDGHTWIHLDPSGSINGSRKDRFLEDTFSHVKGNIENDATADVACDHFHRYKEDIQLVKNLGAKAYRFSISWSRVLPTGRVQGPTGGFPFGIPSRGFAMVVPPKHSRLMNLEHIGRS